VGAAFVLALGNADAGAQTTWPRFSEVVEVTDAVVGHRVRSFCPENTVATRVGQNLYFVYQTGGPDVGNPTDHESVFVRRLHLDTWTMDPAVKTFLQPEDGSGYDGAGYHDRPSLVRDASGAIIPLFNWSGQTAASSNTWSIPPRYRVIPELEDPDTWLPAGGDGKGLPSRIFNDDPHGAIFCDIMGAYDRYGKTAHFVGEGAFLQHGEFAGSCGLGRYYYRTDAPDALDGPYLLVKADCGQPTGYPVPCYGGNVFTKGDVVLGRERSGPRSVHVLWNIRNTFMKRDPVCGCSCPAPGYYQWDYNLYYARSIDGGVTWRSLDGSHAATVADPAPGAINQPLVWNDAGFLVYEGDVNQTSERSFDVDNDGNPVLVIKALVPGTGSYWPNRQTGHVDNSDSIHPPQYALIARHWNGSSWVGSVIDRTLDFFNDWTRTRVDRDDNIWVFVGGWPWEVVNNDLRPRYTVSRDGGSTWQPWTPFLSEGTRLGWFSFYPDPLDPAYIYFSWLEANRMKLVRIQISEAMPVPAEVTGLVHRRLDSERQRLEWIPVAGDPIAYHVYRGHLAMFSTGAYDHTRVPGGCDLAGTSFDVADLGDGVDAYYLIAASNGAQEGALGSSRPPSTSPCP
jgi:hypothetical protein